jgi:cell division septation protein DedD
MHLTRISAMVMLCALLLGITARAQLSAPIPSTSAPEVTVTIQRGVLGDCDDSYLYQYDPDNRNVWWISTFRVGYSHPYERGRYSGLLRFDLTPIPVAATIAQARLLLYCDGWSGSGADLDVGAYAVLREAYVRQATWNEAKPGAPWGQPGCSQVGTDRLADPEGVLTVNGTRRWYEMDVTDMVQRWVSGILPNQGLLLQAQSGLGFFAFSSSDGFDVSLRPQLVVTYAVADSTPTPTVTPTVLPTPTASPTPADTPMPASPTPTGTVAQPPTPAATPTTADVEITATLQQGSDGYSGCQGTYIYQYASNDNYCQRESLQVGYKQQNAALLRFDLASIPANALITQATLQLYATGWGGSDMGLGAYALLRDFDACRATWSQAWAGNPWGQPGCNDASVDRRASPESTVTTEGINDWYDIDLTAIVQDWASGRVPNHGLLLRGSSSTSQAVFFLASAQHHVTGLRPKLVVTYRTSGNPLPTPTAPATAIPTSSPTPQATATPLPSPSPGQATLVIGHIADADIGWAWLESQRLPLVVSTLSQEAQVLVDTGNCTAHGTAEESAEYAELVNGSAAIPWRAVMGTHDRPHTFQRYIGPLQWSWDVGGYRLIGINTQQIDYEALDQSLTREKPCVIFGHLPLGDLSSTDQDELRQRFVDYDIPIYVAGRVRYNSLYTDPQSGTLLLTGSRTVRCHYRLITLRGFEVEDVQFKMACS